MRHQYCSENGTAAIFLGDWKHPAAAKIYETIETNPRNEHTHEMASACEMRQGLPVPCQKGGKAASSS